MAKTSPTQRTLKLLRAKGFVCEITERWNAFARCRQDLLGFIDLIAVDEAQTRIIGVQCTSSANHAARRTKIAESDKARAWRNGGGVIWLVSWRKLKPRGTKVAKWEPRIEEL